MFTLLRQIRHHRHHLPSCQCTGKSPLLLLLCESSVTPAYLDESPSRPQRKFLCGPATVTPYFTAYSALDQKGRQRLATVSGMTAACPTRPGRSPTPAGVSHLRTLATRGNGLTLLPQRQPWYRTTTSSSLTTTTTTIQRLWDGLSSDGVRFGEAHNPLFMQSDLQAS